jgi:uncharacterized phage-like protein YoqJ
MIVGVTGHRPHKLAADIDCGSIKDAMRNVLCTLGMQHGITGMAQGVDTWFAEVCIEDGIPFTAAVPFVGQDSQWPYVERVRYRRLIRLAEKVVYVSSPGYASWKMQARNEWVVDHCDHLLAVWNGSSGGTANAVLYAHKIDRSVSLIEPRYLHTRKKAYVDEE